MLMFDGCDPGANPWVEKYFHDCVMDIRDTVGFALGLFSIFVWLTAQIPQFISNIKNQSSEALSIWFLVEWFAGDTLNLLGCLIQGQQLPTTTILAAYFVLMDVIMLLQYIYYGALQARRKRLRARAARKRHTHRHPSTAHQHNRDNPEHQTVPLLQDGGLNTDISEPVSGPDSSAVHTPAGDSFLRSSVRDSSPTDREGPHRNPLLRLTATTAAGVSLVCVAALALHPGGSSRSSFGAERHLLSIPSQLHEPTALRNDGAGLDAGGSSSTASSTNTAPTFGLAAVSAGAALSVVGRSLATLLYPAAGTGTFIRSGNGTDGGSSTTTTNLDGSSGCSFLNCDVALVAGTAMGYLSTCFYLASRVSQIRKNLARKSTEGLSPVMFLLTMSANMCTGISIVLRLRSLEQAKEQLPWMCGTFGTIALDMTLFYQAMTLGQQGHGHGQHHYHYHHHHHDHLGQGHEQPQGGTTRGHDGPGWPGESPTGGAGCCGKLGDLEAPLITPVEVVDGDAAGNCEGRTTRQS